MAKQDQRMPAGEDYWIRSMGECLLIWNKALEDPSPTTPEIEGVKIKRTEDGWLAILTGKDLDGSPVVGFHHDGSFVGVVQGVANRLLNGSMRWRVDEFSK